MQRKSKEFILKVSGLPQPQQRPRFSRFGNFVKTYDPKQSREAKLNIRALADLKAQEMHWDILNKSTPVRATIYFYMEIPNSRPTWEKRAMESGMVVPTGVKDVDNLAKLVLDSLSGIVFLDDKQIYDLDCHKRYASGIDPITGEEITGPCTVIKIELEYVNIGEIKQELKARGKLAAVRTTKNGKSII